VRVLAQEEVVVVAEREREKEGEDVAWKEATSTNEKNNKHDRDHF
jgi:hypothetical protein